MTSGNPSLLGRFLYALGSAFFQLLFRTVWRLRVVGRENIPLEGPVIFASNHVSYADPPLVGSSAPRTIHFMAKQELFEVPLLGWFIRQVNSFPIKRSEGDVGAFKTAHRILKSGGAMILFPEGTRQKNGAFGRPRAGVGMLSIRTGTPVVPVYVHNTGRMPSFKPLGVYFGKPIEPGAETDYQALSNRVMDAIAGLKETHVGSQS